MQTSVGDVLVAAKNADPNRIHRMHRCLNQTQHQIEIVNHQIEHDTDVGRTTGIRSHALSANELGLKGPVAQLLKCWIESLPVADLHKRMVLLAPREEFLRFLSR